MQLPDPSKRGATRPSPAARTDGPARERPHTRPSATRPRGRDGRSGTGTRPRAVVPASVWAPDSPVDPDAAWPEPILARIVTTLSAPGQAVALLTDRPASEDPPGPAYGTAAAAVVPPGTLAAARELIEAHDRRARIAHCQPGSGDAAAEPFWARFVQPAHPAYPEPTDLARGDGHDAQPVPEPLHAVRHNPSEPAPLVVAAVDPTGAADQFGFAAAELLRDGGTLAVITHCDHQQGRLRDPSGSIVASAQNADLIYLQHIVALHHPIAAGHLTRSRRRETGGVSRHSRVHSDLYLFGRHGQQAAALTQQHAA